MTIRRQPSPGALALCLVLGLLVSACGKKADDGSATAPAAEVMPGSVSDAMINLDTSTASPPMAAVKAAPKKAAAPASDEKAQADEPAAEPADEAPPESADTE